MFEPGLLVLDRTDAGVTLRVRTGRQTNSGGIAELTVCLERVAADLAGLRFESPAAADELPAHREPGDLLPDWLQAAIRDGVGIGRQRFFERGGVLPVDQDLSIGVRHALVHPVDANARRFSEAAARAVEVGLEILTTSDSG